MAHPPKSITIDVVLRTLQAGDTVAIKPGTQHRMFDYAQSDLLTIPRVIHKISETSDYAALWFPEYRKAAWFSRSQLELVERAEETLAREAEMEKAAADARRFEEEDMDAEARAEAVARAREEELKRVFPMTGITKAEELDRIESKIRAEEERQAAEFAERLDNGADASEYEFVQAPVHYNGHPSGVECQVIIRECRDPLIAFAIKHLWRTQWGAKPDNPKAQDLRKVIEYCELELAREAGVDRLEK